MTSLHFLLGLAPGGPHPTYAPVARGNIFAVAVLGQGRGTGEGATPVGSLRGKWECLERQETATQ